MSFPFHKQTDKDECREDNVLISVSGLDLIKEWMHKKQKLSVSIFETADYYDVGDLCVI